MNKILVTAASGLIGYGITRSLKKGNPKYQIIGTSIFDDSPAIAFSDTFLKAIDTDDQNYIPWLIDTIQENGVDLIVPGYDKDVTLWNRQREKLDNSGVKVLLNDRTLIELCDDKWNFYEVLQKNNSSHAIPSSLDQNYLKLKEELGEILLLKPRHGDGSKGIVKITNEDDFNIYRKKIGKDLMVQSFIGNLEEEYTTTAFGDGKGSYYTIITLRRKLTRQGYTGFAEVELNKDIEEAVENLCKIFNPIGPTNFQFRNERGVYKLLEINARLSSATSIRTAFGYNDPLMAAEFYLDNKIPSQPELKRGKAIRYTEDYIIYK